MSSKRTMRRAKRRDERRGKMRYVMLELTAEDLERRQDRESGKAEARNTICGDKELLLFLIGQSPKIGKGQDLIKMAKHARKIEELKDPGMLEMTDEAFDWVSDKINHDKYDAMGRLASGQEVPLYPGPLKLRIGQFLADWTSAPEEMPEETPEEAKSYPTAVGTKAG
jgi:hypothetical protein